MPLQIPPGHIHMSMEHRATGDPDPWYVTFGLEIDEPDAMGAALNAIDQYCAMVLPALGDYVTVTGANVVVGSDGANPRFFAPKRNGSSQGARGGNYLPQNCAVLLDKTTAFGGRMHRGRMFLPAVLTEGEVDNVGVLQGGTVDAWNNRAAQFLADLSDPGGLPVDYVTSKMVILHNGIPGGEQEDPTPVTALTCQNVISTQRRRLR